MKILVSADHIRGPFTNDEPAKVGENPVEITPIQYAALNVARHANPQAKVFAFDGTHFTVAKIEQLRLGFLDIFQALPKWVQSRHANEEKAVDTHIKMGDVLGVQQIITFMGSGEPQVVADAREKMLALIATIYGTNLPSV